MMGDYSEYSNRELRKVNGIVNKIDSKRKYPGYHFISFLIVEGEKEKSYNAELDRARKLTIKNCDPQKSLAKLKDDVHDHWHICCGHDLVSVLSIGLCKAIGSCNANDVKPDVLERSLRLAFERPHFQKTQLYLSIQKWEKTNQPFVVLSVE